MACQHENEQKRTPIVPVEPEHDVHDVLLGTITWDQYDRAKVA